MAEPGVNHPGAQVLQLHNWLHKLLRDLLQAMLDNAPTPEKRKPPTKGLSGTLKYARVRAVQVLIVLTHS